MASNKPAEAKVSMDKQAELLAALGVSSIDEAIQKAKEKPAAMAATPYPESVDPEKKVIVNIPINPMNPMDGDVHVGLNGKFWVIKRGEDVEVPVGVAEILQHSQQQRACAIRYQMATASRD